METLDQSNAFQAPSDGLYFPAALAQEVFSFLDQLEPGNPAFNVAVRFHLAGPLNVSVLEETFVEIIRRHEILRTRMQHDGDEFVQVVLPTAEFKLEVIDLSELPVAERKAETERQGTLEAVKRFVFIGGPLLRGNLLRLADEEHMLQITIHHAISDGYSIGLLTEEIATTYAALIKHEPSPLEPLPIQFADFTLWQREYLKGPEIARELAYWKKRLQDYSELNLPTDRPRPQVKTWSGDIVSILLPSELTEALQKIALRSETTLFMVFLTAFKIMMMRYTGQADIGIGSPIAGRTRPEIEKLIGVFINTLILRTDLSGNPEFLTALRGVRETVLGAMAHQDLPYEVLVKEIHPNRDLTRNPLVQINFTHQRDFVKPAQFAGLTLTAIPSRSPGAIFDLHFFMVERNGVWRASCDFSTDLYDRETALQMLGHLKTLLTAIAAAPDKRIGDYEMLTPDERRTIVQDWNATQRNIPAAETVVSQFEQCANRYPRKIAVICGEEQLTYAQLNRAANALAAKLRDAQVKPGALIGLYLERSVNMVVGLLGILKAGAAYVPMDPAFPAERLRFMIEDADMPVIVSQKRLIEKLPGNGARLVEIESGNGLDENPAITSRPESLAYVIFTSGSTGRPKGVQIPHRALVNFLNSMRSKPGLGESDAVLSVTTLSFDIAGLEIFLPLTSGATVTLATPEISTNPQRLNEEMQRTGTTVLQATPVTWRMLLEDGWKGNPGLKALIGGEAVPRDLVDRLAPRVGSLWNMYGPTETTIWSTIGQLEVDSPEIRIGQPIDNTQVYIVTPELQLQPVGVPGEIVIGGTGLAIGYLKLPALTAEKFVADKIGNYPGGRLYRTGDLGRWRPDGTLECLGRIDQQVKVRGFRIELGEIEAQLAQHPAIRQNVVVARSDSTGEKRLVAYVVLAANATLQTENLRDHLRKKLPEYMVPAAFVELAVLPLTPNGKIDRKALPASGAEPTARAAAVAPRNETEARLAKVFQDVLGVSNISIHDNFFDLGGHSLLAVKLMRGIEKDFGHRLPLARLFSAPTVALLAPDLAPEKPIVESWTALMPITPRPGKPTLYLVHGAGGNLLLYRELVQAIGPEISIYGFQSLGLDRKAEPLGTVKEMAAHYVRELRAFQPSGPYHLAGYCMGGAVSYEMARILRDAGQVVGLVGLLDTYNLNAVKDEKAQAGRFSFLRQRIGFHLDNLTDLAPKEVVGYIGEKLRMAQESGLGKLASSLEQIKQVVRGRTAEPGAEKFIQEINHEAAWHFVPDPSDVQITAFRPQKNYDLFSDPQMGWASVVGEHVEVVDTSANPHAMLIEPHVHVIAEALRSRVLAQSTLL